ncbi:MAG: DegT/DnrJ/EryC1/StrS family aminotransferase [Capsulimonadales bacterium]|nr:DegT/DnrJ/EryC1/StrS family aminotransferase [Capsulimonadales bacterium]
MMKVPLANLPAQYAALKTELDSAVLRALADGAFVLGTTPAANAIVEKLEQGVAEFCGATHGIAVNSGTDALLLSLMALGVGPGDEVITPPFTFVATVETVALLGATPVFADIDPVTFNLDPERVAEKITPRTKAILPVHLFGQMADMTELARIACSHDLPLIGDAAQAIGCAHWGRKVAAWSRLTTLSFYPTKNLGAAGDGGMVLTNEDDLNARLRSLRFHGTVGPYKYAYVGVCSRLDGLQAAILNVKLPHLSDWNEARRRNAAHYSEALADIDGLCLPFCRPENVHTYHQYTVRVLHGKRDELRRFLQERGVASGVFYPGALHLEAAYLPYGGKPGDYPEAERACQEVLSLPIIPELTEEQRAYVVQTLHEFPW